MKDSGDIGWALTCLFQIIYEQCHIALATDYRHEMSPMNLFNKRGKLTAEAKSSGRENGDAAEYRELARRLRILHRDSGGLTKAFRARTRGVRL